MVDANTPSSNPDEITTPMTAASSIANSPKETLKASMREELVLIMSQQASGFVHFSDDNEKRRSLENRFGLDNLPPSFSFSNYHLGIPLYDRLYTYLIAKFSKEIRKKKLDAASAIQLVQPHLSAGLIRNLETSPQLFLDFVSEQRLIVSKVLIEAKIRQHNSN